MLLVVGNHHEDQVKDLLIGHEMTSPQTVGGPITTCPLRAGRSAGRTCAATSRPAPRAWAAGEEFGKLAFQSVSGCSGHGSAFSTPLTGVSSSARIRTLQRELKPGLRRFARQGCSLQIRPQDVAGPAEGFSRHCGRSPIWRAWSRPTTTPSAPCGALSSTASSRLAVSQRRGERCIEQEAVSFSASITCRLQRRSLFGYLSDLLALTPAAIPSRCSRERRGLKTLRFSSVRVRQPLR